MENELQAKFTRVKHHADNANMLDIEFDNIETTTRHHFWSGHAGGFGNVTFWNIPLDEVINLRDKLTAIIDKEVAELNTKIAEPKTEPYTFAVVWNDCSKSEKTYQATDLNDAITQFKSEYGSAPNTKWLSYQIVNKEYQVS